MRECDEKMQNKHKHSIISHTVKLIRRRITVSGDSSAAATFGDSGYVSDSKLYYQISDMTHVSTSGDSNHQYKRFESPRMAIGITSFGETRGRNVNDSPKELSLHIYMGRSYDSNRGK
jgi:hypothetical protein